jgi:hypothetical protein
MFDYLNENYEHGSYTRLAAALIFLAAMFYSSAEFAGFFQLLGGDVIRNIKVNLTPGHKRPDDRL